MELYHITKEEYLPSILSQGLTINSGKTGFCGKKSHKIYKMRYGIQPIFLTTDVDFIIKTMLTPQWMKKNKVITLKVDVELDEKNSSQGWFMDTSNGVIPKEIRYYLNISPKHIKLI